MRDFEQRFVRRLARRAQRGIGYFYAVETASRTAGFPHLHALLVGTSGVRSEDIRSYWPSGISKVEKYDSRHGAAYYVSKDALKNADHWNVSRSWLQPLRPRGANKP